MQKIRNIILIFAIATLLFSCSRGVLFDNTTSVDSKGWNMQDPIVFEVDVKDTLKMYNFYISIRHTTDYEWMNIFFFIKTTFPNNEYAKDTLECYLADLEGKWKGKGVGSLKDNMILFKTCTRFPMKGKYKFEIRHAMRTVNLKNIEDVGLKIEECDISEYKK